MWPLLTPEMFNDVVSLDVNFWKLKERNSRDKKKLTVLKLWTLWKIFAIGWRRWAGAPKSLRVDPHRAQIIEISFDQAEWRGIFVDPVLAKAHCQMQHVDNHSRYLRMMANRTMEDLDVDEADFKQLLDDLTCAKKVYNTIGTYRDNKFRGHPLVFLATSLRTTQICHSWSLRAGSGNRPGTDTNVGWQRLMWKRT